MFKSRLKQQVESLKQTFFTGRWVWRELITKEIKYWAKWMLAALLIMIGAQLLQPWIIGKIVDGLVTENNQMILCGLAGFAGCGLVHQLFSYYKDKAREYVIGLAQGSVDGRITELFFEKSMGQYLQEGSVLNIPNIDKGRWKVIDFQLMMLFEGFPVLVTLLLSYVLLWFLSAVAGLIMTGVLLVYLVWTVFLNQRMVEDCTPIDKEMRQLNRYRLERWEKLERVKTAGKEEEEKQEMNCWFDRVIEKDRSFWLWFLWQNNLRAVINFLALLGIMIYGVHLVGSGLLVIGSLFPLFSWSSRVSENILRLGEIEHQLSWNMPSIMSMMRAVTIAPDIEENPDGVKINDGTSMRVKFENVSYAYPKGDSEFSTEERGKGSPVIKNVSFMVEPGEKAALIGTSGAGKTTVMRLLLRYMDPDEGKIHVNGHVLDEVDVVSWRRAIGYIAQNPMVLDGTIRYNLTYALSNGQRQSVTDEELWRIMRLLKIDFGERLSEGLDTVVGKDGVKLSGGQAQRLMIGSAVIKKPRFMIIDEATSSLDSTTEKAVQEGLAKALEGNISALVIAHRLSTVRNICNKFVVLKEACLDEENQVEAIDRSFEDLYTKSPTFRRLAQDQEIKIN